MDHYKRSITFTPPRITFQNCELKSNWKGGPVHHEKAYEIIQKIEHPSEESIQGENFFVGLQ